MDCNSWIFISFVLRMQFFSLWWNIRNGDQTLRKKKKLSQHWIQKQKWEVVWINKYWNRLWLIKIMHFNAMHIINQLHSVSKILKNETIYKISTVYICLCIYMCVCVCVWGNIIKYKQYIFFKGIGIFSQQRTMYPWWWDYPSFLFLLFIELLPVSTMIHGVPWWLSR